MVEYQHGGWGNHKVYDEYGADITQDIITPEMSFKFGTHIGRVNPSRYRGYYYDAETKLYYLESPVKRFGSRRVYQCG